jgi:hypothetical protein
MNHCPTELTQMEKTERHSSCSFALQKNCRAEQHSEKVMTFQLIFLSWERKNEVILKLHSEIEKKKHDRWTVLSLMILSENVKPKELPVQLRWKRRSPIGQQLGDRTRDEHLPTQILLLELVPIETDTSSLPCLCSTFACYVYWYLVSFFFFVSTNRTLLNRKWRRKKTAFISRACVWETINSHLNPAIIKQPQQFQTSKPHSFVHISKIRDSFCCTSHAHDDGNTRSIDSHTYIQNYTRAAIDSESMVDARARWYRSRNEAAGP